jgi:hypothetical protein
MYAGILESTYRFLHCWLILRHENKWNTFLLNERSTSLRHLDCSSAERFCLFDSGLEYPLARVAQGG